MRARPAGASVSVSRPGSRAQPYRSDVVYPAGPVTVEVRAAGFRTERRTVQIGAGERVVDIALKAITGRAGDRIRDTLPGGALAPATIVLPAEIGRAHV